MGVIPSGISVQEIYRRYRENQIVVNRKYQRRLVWTEDENEFLGYHVDALLEKDICVNFLDYQLAVTSYKSQEEETTFEIFGRVNLGGRQLSNQEGR